MPYLRLKLFLNHTRFTQNENEEKNNQQFKYKQIANRNTANKERFKNNLEENSLPNEIVVEDIPSNNLDRSFDAVSAYMKRRIPNGKNSINMCMEKEK